MWPIDIQIKQRKQIYVFASVFSFSFLHRSITLASRNEPRDQMSAKLYRNLISRVCFAAFSSRSSGVRRILQGAKYVNVSCEPTAGVRCCYYSAPVIISAANVAKNDLKNERTREDGEEKKSLQKYLMLGAREPRSASGSRHFRALGPNRSCKSLRDT